MLLTGFKSYGGRSLNPTEEVVKYLDGKVISGHKICGVALSVDYGTLAEDIQNLVEETKPRVVINLGLWPGESMIRIERVAVNYSDFEIADNTGLLVKSPVVEGESDAYLSTLPIHSIQGALLEKGIPGRLSGTAGNYLCNALMYHALRVCARMESSPLCGFIHVPYLPEQVSELISDTRKQGDLELHQRADLASMSLELIVNAIQISIETTIATLENA